MKINQKLNIKTATFVAVFFWAMHVRYGTGSGPWPPHGLQLATLFTVSHRPFRGPYFFSASIPYCEQVGVYLQEGPSNGEIISWYNLIRPMNGKASISFDDFM